MSADAIIGGTHTFQVIFVDQDTTQPIAVNDPKIDVFHYDSAGNRVDDVVDATMTADITEVGRYQYTFSIASTFADGDVLYGYMTGVKPASTELAFAEQTVNLRPPDSGGGGGGTSGCGMRAQFVKGG